jgi:multidrug efflux pump subunit AcrA (membrane-fusion protein)
MIRTVSHAGAAFVLAFSMIGLGACGEGAGSTPEQAATAPLLLSPEDLVTVSRSPLASGPLITGSVEAGRRADLRAEVPAVVLDVLKENGDPVRAGDLLVRLDQTACTITGSLRSLQQPSDDRGFKRRYRPGNLRQLNFLYSTVVPEVEGQ